MKTSEIISITKDLGFEDLTNALLHIDEQMAYEDSPIILPLVGEFSSGKTTLLNALTDSKKLETATKPTTATIYEIFFGQDTNYATVINGNGEETRIDNMEDLKNSNLADSLLVKVFDTSKKISPYTVLVDTPGLSSSDPRHKQTLVDFLPQADGILLVSDINQQVTRSLTDFIETIKLSKRPIFLVLTKCDTKSVQDIENAKKYISTNTKLPIESIVCVSSVKEDLDELYSLLEKIQNEKGKILKEVNEQRVKRIVNEIIKRIDDLLVTSFSDKDTDEAIREKQCELNKMKRNIDKLVESLQGDIEDAQRNLLRDFEDKVFERLETIVAGKSVDFNSEAITAINSLTSLLLNDYKSELKRCFVRKANEQKGSDSNIDLRCIADMDLSKYSIDGIGYNIDLNELGHQYDGVIGTGVKVAVAAAVVAAVVVTAGGAAAGGAAATGGSAAAGGTAAAGGSAAAEAGAAVVTAKAIDIADTATDVASMVSNKKMANRINKATQFVVQANEQYDKINGRDQCYGQEIGGSKGMVNSMVGFVTDKAWGKPQRRRAIHQYIDETLIPVFKSEANKVSVSLTNDIRDILYQETDESTTSMINAINELKDVRKNKQKEFEQRVEQLRDYKNELITL